MFIAILVLLGLAGAIWYFARKQTQTVTLSKGDIAASDPSIDEVKKANERLDKMSKKIDEALAMAKAEETPSKKVKAEIAEEKAPVVEATPVTEAAPIVESTPVVETSKPPKKKRRYYPKKK